MTEHEEIEYHEILITMLEIIWGEGFLSPGGAEEVALLLAGEDIKDKNVIDIGCGIGGIDVLLARDYGAGSVVGVDIEQPVLDHSIARAETEGLSDKITYQLVEPGPLPFEPASFDVVFSKDAMIHIPEMKGPLYSQMETTLGRENADRYVEIWRSMNVVIESGELRPGHLRAIKPDR